MFTILLARQLPAQVTAWPSCPGGHIDAQAARPTKHRGAFLSNAEPMRDDTWLVRLGCLSSLGLVTVVVSVFVFFTCHPRDRVRVSFRNVPLGTVFLSIIAETKGSR